MFFKSYDGWNVVGEKHKKAVLAQFTKADGETVHYNFSALRRMFQKPSGTMESSDTNLLREAISEGPRFFRSFEGWTDFGRGKKSIMVAQFVSSAGVKLTRSLSSLQTMAANPPKKFSPFDSTLLNAVIQDGPAPRR